MFLLFFCYIFFFLFPGWKWNTQVLQAEIKRKKSAVCYFFCFSSIFFFFSFFPGWNWNTQVLQAEVKRKKSVCYAPKRKVILDEYPDEVSQYLFISSINQIDTGKKNLYVVQNKKKLQEHHNSDPKIKFSEASASAVFCDLPRCQNLTLNMTTNNFPGSSTKLGF